MAVLAESLNQTAVQLIEQYGNTVTLTGNVASGGYDPTTGMFSVNTSSDYVIKAVSSKVTTDTLTKAGLDATSFGLVTAVYTIPYNDDYSGLDNNWTLNGLKIHKVVTIEAQDIKVTMQLFVG